MFFDIVQYGWNNIEHEVLFTGLSEAAAKIKERELIKSFGFNARKRTYNSIHANHEQCSWMLEVITTQSIEQHGGKFRCLDDDWLYLLAEVSERAFTTFLTTTGVELHSYSQESGIINHHQLFLKFPEKNMTFQQAYEWLCAHPPGGEWVEGMHEPILVD